MSDSINNVGGFVPLTFHPSTLPLKNFHDGISSIFSPLPKNSKIFNVIKRVCLVAFAIIAYPVLGLIALVGYPYTKELAATQLHPLVQKNESSRMNSPEISLNTKGSIAKSYYVRFLGIFNKDPNVQHIIQAINSDQKDYESGYNKGSCFYTKDSIQPLVIDTRHEFSSEISVEYPFGVLIDSNVELDYWSLQDMDRNSNRDLFDEKKSKGMQKYDPEDERVFHNLYSNWKTVHFSSINKFKAKVQALHPSNQKNGCYITKGGKRKEAKEIMCRHNEAAIRYQPKKDIKGLLVQNNLKAIALAKDVQKYFEDTYNRKIFISYQSQDDGKLYRIS